MSAICTRGLIVVWLSFSATAATAGPPQPAPRADLYGDPLPDGAIARLGTVRLRHPGLADFMFLDGGKTILTAGGDRVLRFWDFASKQQTRAVTLQGMAGFGEGLALTPDGKTLLTQENGTLTFWDVDTGRVIKSLPKAGPKGPRTFHCFSPSGQWLAVGGGRGNQGTRVSLWDWQRGVELVLKLPLTAPPAALYDNGVFEGRFSPDGKWFVTSGTNYWDPLGIFDVATGREVLRLECHLTYGLAVSPDSKRLLVSSMSVDESKGVINKKSKREATLQMFELPSGKKIAEFPQGDRPSLALAFAPDGKTLVCLSRQATFGGRSREIGHLMDSATGQVLQELPELLHPSFAPDGKTLAFTNDYRLRLWDLAAGKEWHDEPGNFSDATSIAISPDGRLLGTADQEQKAVCLWDAMSGRLLRQFPMNGNDGPFCGVAFSADGKTLMAGHSLGLLRFWNVATGIEQRTVQLHDPSQPVNRPRVLYQIQFSANGKHVFTLGVDDFVKDQSLARWDATTGKLLSQESLPVGTPTLGLRSYSHGQWSSDGKTVALPVSNVVTLLDTETGAVRLRIPRAVLGPVVASTDDRLLIGRRKIGASDGNGAAVGVWECATGQEIAAVKTGPVSHAILRSDNRTLVTMDQEFLKAWDLATGTERRRWKLPAAGIGYWGIRNGLGRFGLVLFPDGRKVSTVLADGTALVWDLASPQSDAERQVKQVTEEEIAAWWTDLSDKNASRAYAAVWRLAEAPEVMVIGFLRSHLKPGAEVDVKLVRRLIADLDSGAFKVRESANRQIEELGRSAVPFVHEILAMNPGLEVQRRLETVLSRLQSLPHSPETLRRLRAFQVLEQWGSPAAQRFLAEIAKGMSHADETVEAQRSLERLARRNVTP